MKDPLASLWEWDDTIWPENLAQSESALMFQAMKSAAIQQG